MRLLTVMWQAGIMVGALALVVIGGFWVIEKLADWLGDWVVPFALFVFVWVILVWGAYRDLGVTP